MPYRVASLRSPGGPRPDRGRWLALLWLFVGASVGHAIARVRVDAPPRFRPSIAARFEAPPTVDGRAFIDGPDRFTVDPSDAVSPAPMRFPSGLLAAVPVDRGWVFVDRDGDVTRADAFLGTPRPLGRFGCELDVDPTGRGRVALVDPDGSLWTTDGSVAPARARLDGPVRRAVFGDRSVGVAVLNDGQLRVTRDGARSWSRRDLNGDLAWDAYLGPDGLTVVSTGDRFVIDASGRLSRRPDARPPSLPVESSVPPALAERIVGWTSASRPTYAPSGAEPLACDHGGMGLNSVNLEHAFQLGRTQEVYECGPASSSPALSLRAPPVATVRLPGGRRSPGLRWVDARGRSTPIAEAFVDRDGDFVGGTTLDLPDGGVALSLEKRFYTHTVGVALDVGPDGRVRGRRPYLSASEATVGMARRGGCVGPILDDQRGWGETQRWVPIVDAARGCPVGVGERLPAFDGPIPPCGAREADALELTIDVSSPVEITFRPTVRHAPIRRSELRTRLELTRTGYCLRSAAYDLAAEGDAPPPRMTFVARPDGELDGVADEGPTGRPRVEPVRCRRRPLP